MLVTEVLLWLYMVFWWPICLLESYVCIPMILIYRVVQLQLGHGLLLFSLWNRTSQSNGSTKVSKLIIVRPKLFRRMLKHLPERSQLLASLSVVIVLRSTSFGLRVILRPLADIQEQLQVSLIKFQVARNSKTEKFVIWCTPSSLLLQIDPRGSNRNIIPTQLRKPPRQWQGDSDLPADVQSVQKVFRGPERHSNETH